MNYTNKLEVIQSLNFPSPEEIESSQKQLIFGRNDCSLWQYLNGLSILEKTCKHVQRVALKGVELSDYLEIGEMQVSPRGNVRQAMFLSGLYHDTGKINPPIRKAIKTSEYMQENGGEFSKEDSELLKEHPIVSAWLEDDPFIRGIIVRHHTYQKDPYPKIPFIFYNKKLFGERNPEVIYLAKLFALIDANDASLTRMVGDNGNYKKLTAEESINSLIEVYGNLDLSYKGNKLPKVKQSGKNLILRLYKEGIFGTP